MRARRRLTVITPDGVHHHRVTHRAYLFAATFQEHSGKWIVKSWHLSITPAVAALLNWRSRYPGRFGDAAIRPVLSSGKDD